MNSLNMNVNFKLHLKEFFTQKLFKDRNDNDPD